MELMCSVEYIVEKFEEVGQPKIYRTFKTEDEAINCFKEIDGSRVYRKIIEEVLIDKSIEKNREKSRKNISNIKLIRR